MAGPYRHGGWRLAVALGVLVAGVTAAVALISLSRQAPPSASRQGRPSASQRAQTPQLAAWGTPLAARQAAVCAMMGGLVVIAAIRCRPGIG